MALDVGAALPVVELADVVVAGPAVDPLDAEPAEKDVAGRLHQSLADHDPPAVVGVLALPDEPLQHRGLGFLRLQEQGILVVPAHEQVDPGTGSDATDAHDFSCGVDVLELLDRVVVVGERSAGTP